MIARASCIVLLVLAALQAPAGDLPVRPEQLPRPEPLRYTPTPPIREALPGGLRLVLLPDRSIPLVTIHAVVRAGSLYDPPGKEGLARITAGTLARGGSSRQPANALNERLESLGASFATETRREVSILSVELLSKDLDAGLGLLAEVLTDPAFGAPQFEAERAGLLEERRRRAEAPFDFSREEFRKLLYGPKSPWARTPSAAGLAALSREDCLAFYRARYTPSRTVLAVAGDFDILAFRRRLAGLFGSWAAEGDPEPLFAPAPEVSPRGIFLMDKPDLTQATILMGELTGKRIVDGAVNPDRYPLDVLNHILGGGGFNSMLMREIRSNRGLAYGTGSFYSLGKDRGVFVAFCQTALENTGAVIGLLRQQIAAAAARPPASADLARSKSSLVKAFVFDGREPAEAVKRAAVMGIQGYPADYRARYAGQVEDVFSEEVLAAARRTLHPEEMLLFVLGPADALEEPLKAYGEVTILPMPEP